MREAMAERLRLYAQALNQSLLTYIDPSVTADEDQSFGHLTVRRRVMICDPYTPEGDTMVYVQQVARGVIQHLEAAALILVEGLPQRSFHVGT